MATFRIQIARTITTVIEVEAPTAAAARAEVIAYGADLAASDFRQYCEWMTKCVVQRVERA